MKALHRAISDAIPAELRPLSGKVFYSGPSAYSQPGTVYLLGRNPGGDPVLQSGETIGEDIRYLAERRPERWSAFLDESWGLQATGQARLQRRIQHLFDRIGLDLRDAPASNLVFVRSRQVADLGEAYDRQLIDLCWPFHVAMIEQLSPRAVVCFGVETGQVVASKLGCGAPIGIYKERNRRRWASYAWQTCSGRFVFGLTHPGRANWLSPSADPAPFVAAVLNGQKPGVELP
ncbi:hypothetical protein [Chthonobacter albigriseus]|uniref:hypothetical protein n=1 Tax=Chthonobacter albigriseus TaxID=1683161 RepID=UPI0015EFB3C1|nr:hypothetical protein [Chthonobacter albigriseus]